MDLKLNQNIIALAILIGGILIAGAILYTNKEKILHPSYFLSSQEAGQKVISFIKENLLTEDQGVSLSGVKEESGLYKVTFRVGPETGGQEFKAFVSKDGKLLFFQAIDMDSFQQTAQKEKETAEVPKSDKPDVKLFVMSYCPYGLQMEKAFLPVYKLLKDKANMGIYFVDYIMHEKKEIDENLRQYCIQKEEKEKYSDYLDCFVKSGEAEECLEIAQIDKTKLEGCISQTDEAYQITKLYEDKSTWLGGTYPRFDIHKELNEKYQVQGSPTLVINDKVVYVKRSPEKIKEIICQAFNSPPEQCSQTLSTEIPSSGIGGESGGTFSEGGCEK